MIKAWKSNHRWYNLSLYTNWKSFRFGVDYKGKIWGMQPTWEFYFMFWTLKFNYQKRYK